MTADFGSRDEGENERRQSAPSMPGWVKASLIVVAVLVLTFIVLQLVGIGPRHGPGRHMQHSGQQPFARTLV